MSEWPRQSPVDVALRGACPRCGRGRLFRGLLTVVDRCAVCDLDLRGNDAASESLAGLRAGLAASAFAESLARIARSGANRGKGAEPDGYGAR